MASSLPLSPANDEIDTLIEEMGRAEDSPVNQTHDAGFLRLDLFLLTYLLQYLDSDSFISLWRTAALDERLHGLFQSCLSFDRVWLFKELNWSDRKYIKPYRRKITRVKLGPGSRNTAKRFEDEISEFDGITHITLIDNIHVKNIGSLYLLPQLSSLTIVNCPSVDYLALGIIISHARKLRRLLVNRSNLTASMKLELLCRYKHNIRLHAQVT